MHSQRNGESKQHESDAYFTKKDSSVSIVSGYGLDDQAIEVLSPAEAKGFFPVAPVSGADPACCTVGTGGPFARGKAQPGSDADHSPHLS
jgi:hypothetical protein